MNLVSIIIPIYNRHKHANRAVQSVLDQKHQNWELFLIDDNSVEPYLIPEFCVNIKHKITLLRNETNLGPGLSRQRGLDLAKGDYVCFLDSDDYWKPEFLSESLKVHETNPHLAATYCQSEMMDGTLRRRNNVEDAIDDIFYGVVSGVRPWATCAIMWKRQFLGKWNSIRTNQDALFEMNAALINPQIQIIPKILCTIDKGTGENSVDLVGNKSGNENRFKVLLKSCDLLNAAESYKNKKSENALWESLFIYWKKMLRQKDLLLSIKGFIYLMRFYKWK